MPKQLTKHLVGAAILSVAIGTMPEPLQAAEPPAPLRDLPKGWLHIPEECIDCWMGAYHDAVSGAYVRYSTSSVEDDRAHESFGLSEGEGSTATGTVDGLTYRVLRVPDGRSFMTRRIEIATKTPIEDLPSEATRMLPPAKVPYLVITLLSKPWVWGFEAAISTVHQEERLRSLLLSVRRLDPGTSGNVYERARTLEAPAIRSLRQGMAASEILHGFGRPRHSSGDAADGFTLVYDIKGSDGPSGTCEVSLGFGRDQRFIRHEAASTCATSGTGATTSRIPIQGAIR